MMADTLPDDALVVRGGENKPENFAKGSGVSTDVDGKLHGVSVNSADQVSIEELTAPRPPTGYPGILNNQIGVTTVGAIRASGGDVTPSPTTANPMHATLSGLTPEQAASLFRPTVRNPSRAKSK